MNPVTALSLLLVRMGLFWQCLDNFTSSKYNSSAQNYNTEKNCQADITSSQKDILKVQSSLALCRFKSKGIVITLDGILFSVFDFWKLKEEIACEKESFLTWSYGSNYASIAV